MIGVALVLLEQYQSAPDLSTVEPCKITAGILNRDHDFRLIMVVCAG